jgi:hypothetical protein
MKCGFCDTSLTTEQIDRETTNREIFWVCPNCQSVLGVTESEYPDSIF